jgi:DNA polymerase-3 subunit epsilon
LAFFREEGKQKMGLEKIIIDSLDRDSLKAICRDHEAEVDYRSKEAMAEHLRRRGSIGVEVLLEFLSEAQVKVVCEACGLSSVGRRNALIKKLIKMKRGPAFVAIDFETADYRPDSACAVALVRVENHRIVRKVHHLIRPPRKEFVFTYLHNIAWEDVAQERTFGELWPQLAPLLEGAEFLAAHNAGFDRSVLHTCCAAYGLPPPPHPFRCTVKLARETWRLYPTKLPDVCRHLGIPLKHHDAASDAEACARIVLAHYRHGHRPG